MLEKWLIAPSLAKPPKTKTTIAKVA